VRETESRSRPPRVDRLSRCDLAAVTRRRPGVNRSSGHRPPFGGLPDPGGACARRPGNCCTARPLT